MKNRNLLQISPSKISDGSSLSFNQGVYMFTSIAHPNPCESLSAWVGIVGVFNPGSDLSKVGITVVAITSVVVIT